MTTMVEMATKMATKNINGLLAEEYILGKLVPKTRRQYQLCVIKMKDWIKTNYPGEYDSSLEDM